MSLTGAALPSKLLARLDAAIARSVHPVEQACLRAERAGHWAQQGHFTDARTEVEALQRQFHHQPHPAVSAWLTWVEGLIAFFDSVSAAARDKFRRAQALSAASRLPQLQALCAAWLAHTDYVALDFEAMAKHLREALTLASADHHSARARACLTTGTALHYAERMDLAKPWYARSREHASLAGDEVTLIGLSSNMAWLHGMHALQASIFGGALDDHARQALAGAGSTDNLDQWAGTTSLDQWTPMLRAVTYSVRGDAEQALALYLLHWPEARKQGLGQLGAGLLADMAWCRWRVGDAQGAQADAAAAQACLGSVRFADDRAVAHGRLAQVLRVLGHVDQALDHEMHARTHWAEHHGFQKRVVDLIGDWSVV